MKKLSKTLISGAAASLVVAAGLAFAQTNTTEPLPSGNTGGTDMSNGTTNGNSTRAVQPESGAVNSNVNSNSNLDNRSTSDLNSTTNNGVSSTDSSLNSDSSLEPRADRN
jgi:hypothetical protein